MAHRMLVLVLVTALALAGCTSPTTTDIVQPSSVSPPGEEAPQERGTKPGQGGQGDPGQGLKDADAEAITLSGYVLDRTLQPVASANVTMLTREAHDETGPDGYFDLGTHPRNIYPLQISAAGFQTTNVTVAPDADTQDLRIVLERGAPVVPYQQTWKFQGILQCAFEALIISPSCDSALVAAGLDPVFGTNQSFLFDAGHGWKTLVLDIVFDPDAHPGLDGLRIALRGSLDPEGGGEYQQYGRFFDADPFTVRIEPGETYHDGVEPVPINATGFQVDVYPHSHGYHPGGAGFLGVGAAIDVEFQVYATVFYVEEAPDGYSFIGAA